MRLKKKYKIILYVSATLLLGWVLTVSGISAFKYLKMVDAYNFVVDGEVLYTVPADQQEELELLIKKYKLNFLSIANISPSAKILDVDFRQDIQVVPTKVEVEELDTVEDVALEFAKNETEAVYYTVVSGDNLWDIGIANDINLAKIVEYNPDLDIEKYIQPGDQFLFQPANPLYDVEVHLQNTTREPVPFETIKIQDATLLTSQRVILKEGVAGEKSVTYDIKMENGYAVSIEPIQETVLVQPISAEVKVGTKRTLSYGGGSNYGVTTGRLSSGYGYRTHPISGVRTFHNGIDIAASTGTGVYVYASGTVIAVSQDNTLGKYIAVDHGNGLVTRYLHLSKFNVSKGDKVSTGDRIGSVGNTGYSTGSHLHFEVLKNGSYQDPWNYI
jgi:murein DD-endopeptidase MepM/ murein hydrolase activator NlpD